MHIFQQKIEKLWLFCKRKTARSSVHMHQMKEYLPEKLIYSLLTHIKDKRYFWYICVEQQM